MYSSARKGLVEHVARNAGVAVSGLVALWAGFVLDGPCRSVYAEEAPDIRSIEPDLRVPGMVREAPRPGIRVRQTTRGYDPERVYHSLYLPINYEPNRTYPLIVEFAGNGGYRNSFGDTCDGLPGGCKLGFGISGGKDFVWLCLPFLADAEEIATQWWGRKPDWDPLPTVNYAKKTIAQVSEQCCIDSDAILLCGFSRGAIACNRVGLHDDQIASLWCGAVVYSHYDGVRDWGLPGSDRASAEQRLRRLKARPQFICHETVYDAPLGLAATRRFIEQSGVAGDFTFAETGFRNHNDAWVLRDCDARAALRAWLAEIPQIQSPRNHLGGNPNVPGN